jgi:hypothetical protein
MGIHEKDCLIEYTTFQVAGQCSFLQVVKQELRFLRVNSIPNKNKHSSHNERKRVTIFYLSDGSTTFLLEENKHFNNIHNSLMLCMS